MKTPELQTSVEGHSTPCGGWAALEEYVERKISEARRAVKMTTELAFEGSDAPAHWRGHLAALVRLRRKMKRTKEAPPNDGDQP